MLDFLKFLRKWLTYVPGRVVLAVVEVDVANLLDQQLLVLLSGELLRLLLLELLPQHLLVLGHLNFRDWRTV